MIELITGYRHEIDALCERHRITPHELPPITEDEYYSRLSGDIPSLPGAAIPTPGTHHMGPELEQALAMIDAFTSIGARGFDVTILDINGDEVPGLQRPRSTLIEVKRMIGRTLQEAERNQHSVIIRPRSTGPKLIQLDDLNAEKAAHIAPYAFIQIETSPGNFQSWVAVSDIPKDQEEAREFARRLKRGAGADRSATAAVRIAGSRNFKTKYAPALKSLATLFRLLPRT